MDGMSFEDMAVDILKNVDGLSQSLNGVLLNWCRLPPITPTSATPHSSALKYVKYARKYGQKTGQAMPT